jgi:tetratricopeptide (TPR) repeat protein
MADVAAQLQAVHAAIAGRDLARAEALCHEALAAFGPRADVVANLGAVLLMQGRFDDAAGTLRRASAAMPNHPGILGNLGLALLRAGHAQDAVAILERAVALDPRPVDARNNLGLAHAAAGDVDAACAAFAAVLERAPDHTPALSNWCDALVTHGRLPEAIDLAARFASASPHDAGAAYKLGYLRVLAGELDAAAAAFERALAHAPQYAPTRHNLGTLAMWQGALDTSIAHFRAALALDPGYADARFGLACALLKSRNAVEGWPAFEARHEVHATSSWKARDTPTWDGRAMPDGTLLVLPEEGLGDVLQFARFLPAASARVGRLVLACGGYWAPLARLLAGVPGVDVVAIEDLPALKVDAQCALLSLPLQLRLGTTAWNPSDAYLAAAQEATARWRARLAPLRGLRVGLCWSGNARRADPHATRIDERRSLPLHRLAALAEVQGVHFISVQKRGADAVHANSAVPLIDWTGELTDFADTAALMQSLDLVISVDTSVVHCAGALGRPVWMLDRFDNCWRWGTDAAAPGWYASLRVFRQARFREWDGVVRDVRAALEAAVRGERPLEAFR